MKKKILIIDDEKDICFLISEILKDEDYITINNYTSTEAINNFNKIQPDLVILDVWLETKEIDGLKLLKYFKNINNNIPVIMISGHSTIDMAVQAIKEGAYDFIEKPFDTNKLLIVTKRAIENSKLIQENLELKKLNYQNYELIGKSNFVEQLKINLNKISSTLSRILINGPTGSGKETIAYNIHKKSKRNNNPFLVAQCNLIHPDNIEELIFGSISNNITGLLEKANTGSLVFDEIFDLPSNIQNKLLKFIQENYYYKVDSKEKFYSDIRIISTNSKNLNDSNNKLNINIDLYNRLKVIEIIIPPLSKRPEDIKLLCDYFIKNSKYHNNKTVFINEDAYVILESYHWPGNIRQLRNLIDRILIMHDENNKEIKIDASKIPLDMGEINTTNSQGKSNFLTLPMKEAREIFEKNYLLSQIKRFNGNISKVAAFVGMERTALYRKIKSLNINIEN
tara:strand:- start:1572 stop:2930 length:1359 start_codon:yes stop_codon:yes gene_type:complete